MEPIVIKTSIQTSIKFAAISIAFIALGYWMFGLESERYSKELMWVVGGLGMAMGAFGIVFFTLKLFKKDKTALIINKDGITEKSTGVSLGFIPWADITGLRVSTIHSGMFNKTHFISVDVKNPEDYIAKAKNVMVRQALNWNMTHYGSPINIMPQPLDMSNDELEKMLKGAFEYYKVTNPSPYNLTPIP